MSILIRPVVQGDVPGILEIYTPYIASSWTSFEESVPGVVEMWERISKLTADYPWLVAVDHQQIIGYAYGSKHRYREAYRWSCEVSAYVHADMQGRGLGRLLYETLFELLQEQNLCVALAGVVIPNHQSIEFHKHLGFHTVGIYRKIGYKFGAWHDVQWLQRPLKPQTSAPGEFVAFSEIPKAFVEAVCSRERTKKG